MENKHYAAEARFKKKSLTEIERLAKELKATKDKKEVPQLVKKIKEELRTSVEIVTKN